MKSTKPLLLVFNKDDSNISASTYAGDKQFVEQMFNISELMKEYDSFNVLYTSAATGVGCSELHMWIQEVLGSDSKKKKKTLMQMCSCLLWFNF